MGLPWLRWLRSPRACCLSMASSPSALRWLKLARQPRVRPSGLGRTLLGRSGSSLMALRSCPGTPGCVGLRGLSVGEKMVCGANTLRGPVAGRPWLGRSLRLLCGPCLGLAVR